MRGRLNFARAPFRNERLPRSIFGLAAAALLGVTILHGVVLTRYLMREQEELDVKVEVLQEALTETEADIQRTENELRSQRNDVRTERIRFLANVYRHKGFSWTGLFNELESLTPAKVRITSISPAGIADATDEMEEEIQVELRVVARNLDDVLEMVKRLEAARYLTTVLPQMVSEGDDSRGAEGWSAALTLQYLPHHRSAELELESGDGVEDQVDPDDIGPAVPGEQDPVNPVVPGYENPDDPAAPDDKDPVDPAVPGDGARTPGVKK